MPRWYVLLDGPQEDLVHVKRLYTSSGFAFDQIDGKEALYPLGVGRLAELSGM